MSRKVDALNAYEDSSYMLMNPADAEKHGFTHGDTVKVWNDRGELETILRISDQVLESELFMPWHFSEAPVNALTRDELDPHSKIAPFKLSAVRVEKI